MSSLLGDFNFGLNANNIRQAGGRVDSAGNVHWTLGTLSSPSLTAFTNPYTGSITGSNGSNMSGSGSFFDSINAVGNRNRQVVRESSKEAASLALDAAKTLDPYVAKRFYEGLDKAFPGYRDVFGQMTKNTMAELHGVIPDDAADLIRMYSAEQNVSGAHANVARNLGRTSVDQMTAGFAHGQSLFDIASKNLTPEYGDVYTSAENIRTSMVETGTLSPAAALSAKVTMRGQDLQKQIADAGNDLQRRQLQQELYKFNTEVAWDKEMNSVNTMWNKMMMSMKERQFNASEQARREENETFKTYTAKYGEVLSTIKGPGSTLSAPKRSSSSLPKLYPESGTGSSFEPVTFDASGI